MKAIPKDSAGYAAKHFDTRFWKLAKEGVLNNIPIIQSKTKLTNKQQHLFYFGMDNM